MSNNYNPAVKLYYVSGNNSTGSSNRIVPAPGLSLSQEYYYANNIAIGYTYVITLNGYATSLDLTSNNITDLDFTDTLTSIKKIKNIFNKSNGSLILTNASDAEIFKATGGMLRSINFEQGDNQWFNYAPYSVEIEFNEIEVGDCGGLASSISCGDLPTGLTNTPLLLDMTNYKVKSFNDSWSFNIGDTIYNSYEEFTNEHFEVTYNIEAVGKHYFNGDNLLPAWEQAKNFVQKRLVEQVNRLISNVLKRTEGNACSISETFASVFGPGPPGSLSGLPDADYKVFNERISCDSSESDGSFKATYKALVKKAGSSSLNDENVIHTFTLSKDVDDNPQGPKVVTASINGSIQGLIYGGLIKSDTILQFPGTGELLLTKTPNIDKYKNALNAYNKIGEKKKLKTDFVEFIGITNGFLEASGECIDADEPASQVNHNVTHNYIEGTIDYSATFSSENACIKPDSSIRSITFDIQPSTPQIAEFIIPGRTNGPILQNIGADSPGRITITYEGSKPPDCCPDLDDVGANCDITSVFISGLPPAPAINGYQLLSEKPSLYSNGSYTVVRTYIQCDT